MKFREAYDKAFEIEQSENRGLQGISENTARIAAFVWNMIAVANGNFDDVVVITPELNAKSKPITEKKAKNSASMNDVEKEPQE
jgi:hypothetical protein